MIKEIKLKWKKEPFMIHVYNFKYFVVFSRNERSMSFEFRDLATNFDYLYEWVSNSFSGISYLSSTILGETKKTLYNPYSKENDPQYIDLIEVARQIAVELQNNLKNT